jgi:two-component system chemotaxis response regulator CheY
MSQGSKKPARVLARDKAVDAQSLGAQLDRLVTHQNANIFNSNTTDGPRIPILLVEDQALMRKAFKRILEPTHLFTIQESQSPKDAIQYLRNHAIDLVILDLYLSKGSGIEVLNYIRSRPIANDIPVIFVTGEASRDDIVHAIELGVNDYLIKPFEPQDLILKIKQVLGRYIDPPERLKQLRSAEADLIRGNTANAHAAFVTLYEQDPESPRVIVGLAQAESRLGQTGKAKELIERAIRISDMCFPAYALMADLLILEGKKHEAIEFLLRELSLNGKRVGRRVQLADLYFELHDYRAGLEQMRLALIDFPNDESLLLKTAQLNMDCGDNDKALHYFLKTRRNVPRSSMALRGISEVCLKLGNGKRALQIFTDFLNQKPNQADVLHARATVYEKMNCFEDAITDIDTCLSLEPDQIEPMTTKGRLLKKSGQEMPARMVWASLTRMEPSAETMSQVGMINFAAGDYTQAALYFERAVFAEANHEKSLYHLALCYKKLDQIGKAKAICQQALALTGNPSEFRKLLEELSGQRSSIRKGDKGGLPQAG